MKLSIVFITFNRGNELIRAIESCFPVGIADYEIIIWDNNSKDEDKRIIQKYIDNSQENIQYYYSDTNLGVAGGRNSAWNISQGEYVFFLDDDAVIKDKNYFPSIIQYMENHPQVAALAVEVYEPKSGIHLIPKQRFKGTDGEIQVLCYIGCAFMLRRKSIKKHYLYPEKLMFGSEEYYSSMLIWNDGFRIDFYRNFSILHMPSKINRCIGKERAMNFISNTHLIRLLTYPIWMIPFLNLTFVLRVYKNKLRYSDCRALIRERFNKDEIDRIKTRTVLELIYKFGLSNII